MTLPDDTTAILQALGHLELKLTTLIATSMATVQEKHSALLLEQAKLNATFAHRETVENITRRVDAHAGELTRLNHQVDKITTTLTAINTALEFLAGQLDRRTLRLFTTISGYALGAAALTAASLITWAITHFSK